MQHIRWTIVFAVFAVTGVSLTGFAVAAEQPESDVKALTARLAALEATVKELDEIRKIHDVYVRYGRGIDRLDEELLRSVYWPKAQINYGTESLGSIDEYLKAHTQGFIKGGWPFGHLLTNEAIDVDGDVAHVEVYVTGMLTFKEKGLFFSGRYIDRLDRRNGEWRISVREFIPHYASMTDTTVYLNPWGAKWFKEAKTDCWKPLSGKRDTSYLRPLTARNSKEVGPPCAEE